MNADLMLTVRVFTTQAIFSVPLIDFHKVPCRIYQKPTDQSKGTFRFVKCSSMSHKCYL